MRPLLLVVLGMVLGLAAALLIADIDEIVRPGLTISLLDGNGGKLAAPDRFYIILKPALFTENRQPVTLKPGEAFHIERGMYLAEVYYKRLNPVLVYQGWVETARVNDIDFRLNAVQRTVIDIGHPSGPLLSQSSAVEVHHYAEKGFAEYREFLSHR